MAARHMKVKKIVLSIITLAIMFSQLAGCAMLSPTEINEIIMDGSEVVIEMVEPISPAYSEKQLSAETVNNQEVESQEQLNQVKYISSGELLDIFKESYNLIYTQHFDMSEQDKILIEMACVNTAVADTGKGLMDGYDLEAQYKVWRSKNHPVQTLQDISQITPEVKQQKPAPAETPAAAVESPAAAPVAQAPSSGGSIEEYFPGIEFENHTGYNDGLNAKPDDFSPTEGTIGPEYSINP